jgi:hypothetical protein
MIFENFHGRVLAIVTTKKFFSKIAENSDENPCNGNKDNRLHVPRGLGTPLGQSWALTACFSVDRTLSGNENLIAEMLFDRNVVAMTVDNKRSANTSVSPLTAKRSTVGDELSPKFCSSFGLMRTGVSALHPEHSVEWRKQAIDHDLAGFHRFDCVLVWKDHR